jgi:hypothetical protein
MVRSLPALLLAALIATGCSDGKLALETPTRRVDLAPGEHRITVAVPLGWSVANQGSEIRIRQGTIADGERIIEIRDLGPAGLEGVRDEVERARDLWSSGRDLDARWRLRRIAVPREWFPTAIRRRDFWGAMDEVTGAPRGAGYDQVQDAFDALIDSVRALEAPPLDAAVASALGSIEDLKNRREIGPRRLATIDGREAVVLETHYRLTHSDPRRYVVVRNGSRLLALWMDRTRSGPEYPAFDTIVKSLRFRGVTPAPPKITT